MEDGNYITGVSTPHILIPFPQKQFSNVVGHHTVVFHDGTSTLTPEIGALPTGKAYSKLCSPR